eukprot:1161555-Pelagomonas_calceolata.AAC.6
MVHVTSSAIGNAPPPDALVNLLNRAAKRSNLNEVSMEQPDRQQGRCERAVALHLASIHFCTELKARRLKEGRNCGTSPE